MGGSKQARVCTMMDVLTISIVEVPCLSSQYA